MIPLRRLYAFMIISLPVTTSLCAELERAPIAIVDATVIDVAAVSEDDARLEHQTIVIEGNRIIQLGILNQISVPKDAHRIDGRGKYVLPGFWDMHAHVSWADGDVEKIVLPLMFANGITGLRDLSSFNPPPQRTLPQIRKLQRSISKGELIGPRFMALCLRVNSSREMNGMAQAFVGPQTAEQGARSVLYAKSMRVDFIKVYSGVTRPAFFGLMEKAEELGVPVAGHLPMAVTPIEASNAGMGCIEHARFPALACGPDYEAWRRAVASYGERRSDDAPIISMRKHQRSLIANFDEERCLEICDTFAKNKTHICPTHTTRKMDAFATDPGYCSDPRRKYVSPSRLEDWDLDLQNTASAPPWRVTYFKEFFELGLRVTGMAHRRGVRILAGTDTYDTHVFPGFSYHDELEHLNRAGLSSLDVLKSGTIHAAEFLNEQESYGSVAVGKVADLIVLDADPLADISNSNAIHTLIFDGQVYPKRKLEKMVQAVEAHVQALKQHVIESSPKQHVRYDAILTGDFESVLAAIENGANVNGLDVRRKIAEGNGHRPPDYEAPKNDLKIIAALLDVGADVNATNRSGYSPLHYAAKAGSTAAARLLIDKGPTVDAKNRRSATALDVAIAKGHDETAGVLSAAKAVTP